MRCSLTQETQEMQNARDARDARCKRSKMQEMQDARDQRCKRCKRCKVKEMQKTKTYDIKHYLHNAIAQKHINKANGTPAKITNTLISLRSTASS